MYRQETEAYKRSKICGGNRVTAHIDVPDNADYEAETIQVVIRQLSSEHSGKVSTDHSGNQSGGKFRIGSVNAQLPRAFVGAFLSRR